METSQHLLTRREFLGLTAATVAVPFLSSALPTQATSRELYQDTIGAAHVAGKYFLTNKPYLIEGGEKLINLGTRVGKFWFEKGELAQASYPYNSDWGNYPKLVDLAKSAYFSQLLSLPFSTIFLVTDTLNNNNWVLKDQRKSYYQDTTEEYFQLARHFYTQFGDRNIRFVLQNWEGDWLLANGTNRDDIPISILQKRAEGMMKGLAARQNGVTEARQLYDTAARCQVLYAVEVNRTQGHWGKVPTVTRNVLPHLNPDLVSYSSWENSENLSSLREGIAEIKSYAQESPIFGNNQVYIGEIGASEHTHKTGMRDFWEKRMGLLLEEERLPYVVIWQLYDNETKEYSDDWVVDNPRRLRGHCLIWPDGKKSQTGQFFSSLWNQTAA